MSQSLPEAPPVALLGVRHHGPGSARAVAAALAAYRPDCVLVEGPPEADALLPLAAEADMQPPVALLAHVVDEPARAAFWPFAAFSPEWVAIRWALDAQVPVRFIDLPAAHSLALPREESTAESTDPIAELARAAGDQDSERWWEDAVEHRLGAEADALAPFAALAEAMAVLREEAPESDADGRREAYMRKQLRAARRAGHRRIAVVCGAWHVPALAAKVPAAQDAERLKGLPRAKVELTWVPWTHGRLSAASGYGAGITSPGWYQHLFDSGADVLPRWLARVAELLRDEDVSVSSAHVIEAVRLAEALAAMRGRPLAGLEETLDAVRAVMCEGSDIPLGLVLERLVVGDVLGQVPDAAPAVPLQRDLTRAQRALRLRPEASERALDLDLRKETDAARSRLLHRLQLLGVDWGRPAGPERGSTGTFRESWKLCWYPELAVRTAEAGAWGTTVVTAATARAAARAAEATALPELTALAESCLLADLPEALPVVITALGDRAALDSDAAHLAQALPALVRALRYGDVRGTDASSLHGLAESLAVRLCVSLPIASGNLDADASRTMAAHLAEVHGAIALLSRHAPAPQEQSPAPDRPSGVAGQWQAALRGLVARELAAPLVRGRAARLLLDDGLLEPEEAQRELGLALSTAVPPAEAAAWIEGFLAGSGMLLLHDRKLLALLDDWLAGLPVRAFPELLPLLRRTFAQLEAGVRRNVGQLVREGNGGRSATPQDGFDIDEERAAPAVATVRLLLGIGGSGHE